ncbi:MAG: hypothetical protein WCO33_03055 [bacterium]
MSLEYCLPISAESHIISDLTNYSKLIFTEINNRFKRKALDGGPYEKGARRDRDGRKSGGAIGRKSGKGTNGIPNIEEIRNRATKKDSNSLLNKLRGIYPPSD